MTARSISGRCHGHCSNTSTAFLPGGETHAARALGHRGWSGHPHWSLRRPSLRRPRVRGRSGFAPSRTLTPRGLNPDTKGKVEFPTVYDHCYPSALRQVFREAQTREVDLTICWGQPGYFEFFLPVFASDLHCTKRFVERRVVEDAASYVIVHAWA